MTPATRPRHSIARVIIRNTLYNIVGRFWAVIVAAFLTPYILHRIGAERYGIFALCGAFAGYVGLLDFGFGSSFGRFIAEYHASREEKKLCAVIGTGFIFYLMFGLLLLVAASFLLGPFVGILKIDPSLQAEAVFVLWVTVAIFILSSIAGIFNAVQTGLQRMDLTNKIAIALSFVTVSGTIFALSKGFGLPGVVLVNAFVFLLLGIINMVVAFRVVPGLARHGVVLSRETFRELFSFGYKVQVARISGIMTTQVDKVLIGVLLSVNLVTAYQLGSSVIFYGVSFAGLFVTALMPAFTDIAVREGTRPLVNAYLRSTRFLAIIVVPAFMFVIASAPVIMYAWLSQPHEQSAWVMRIVGPAWLVSTMARVAASVCIAINKPQLMVRGSIIIVVLNLVLSIVGIKLFGIMGAAWGNAIGVATGTLYFLWELNKDLGVRLRTFAATVLPYLASAVAAASVVWLANRVFFGSFAITDRIRACALLAIQGGLFAGTYLFLAFASGALRRSDIDYFHRRFLVFFRRTPAERNA